MATGRKKMGASRSRTRFFFPILDPRKKTRSKTFVHTVIFHVPQKSLFSKLLRLFRGSLIQQKKNLTVVRANNSPPQSVSASTILSLRTSAFPLNFEGMKYWSAALASADVNLCHLKPAYVYGGLFFFKKNPCLHKNSNYWETRG